MMVARDKEEGEVERSCFMVTEFQFYKMKELF